MVAERWKFWKRVNVEMAGPPIQDKNLKPLEIVKEHESQIEVDKTKKIVRRNKEEKESIEKSFNACVQCVGIGEPVKIVRRKLKTYEKC